MIHAPLDSGGLGAAFALVWRAENHTSHASSIPWRYEVPKTEDSDIAQLSKERRQTLVSEFWDFLKHNKKWWLLPILLVVLLLGMLVFLSGSGAAPFVYTLF